MLPFTKSTFRLLQSAEETNEQDLLRASERSSSECWLRNDRQSYLHIVQQLLNAQFLLSDQELASRLWHEVRMRDLDVGRIIHLLYGATDHSDEEAMRIADDAYLALIDPAERGKS